MKKLFSAGDLLRFKRKDLRHIMALVLESSDELRYNLYWFDEYRTELINVLAVAAALEKIS